mmetsp:Transcript_31766/g.36699  ORF Transcript_31766/g.36699 Transcript_31766/m.36699 type:complete len:353 (+) Transcript_31766:73-1131(+)
MPCSVTHELLARQNAETSSALIDHWKESESFALLANSEGESILKRDEEDATKLQKGIDVAKAKGVIDPLFVPEDYCKIDVLGQTANQVANDILKRAEEDKESKVQKGSGTLSNTVFGCFVKKESKKTEDKKEEGNVIVICGLSGTGKGTTVSTLKQNLEEEKKTVVCWSNGNIFRSITLLAATWCEMQEDSDGSFDSAKACTKENLASFMDMLKFGKFNGKYDTHIKGLGLDMYVSEVQNTELKAPKVAKNIPTVAEFTQGEVILFAAGAIKVMDDDGITVLLEGRKETVDYVRTPYRFTLMLSDKTLIGKRRAAQRLMASSLQAVGSGADTEVIGMALERALSKMVAEIEP